MSSNLTAPEHLRHIPATARGKTAEALRRERDEWIVAAISAGCSTRQVAEATGLSAPRVRDVASESRGGATVATAIVAPAPAARPTRTTIATVAPATCSTVDSRTVAVTLPREPWECPGARIARLPGYTPSAAMATGHRPLHGVARVSAVKRIIQEVAAMPADDGDPRELAF